MPTWRFSGIGSSLIAFLMGTTAAVNTAQAQTAGTVGAVNNDATGQPPGAASRSLDVGQSVVQKERIVTNASGTTQIMFNDRSAMNVGRDSTVVIDRFIYDASAGTGDMAVSMARGVARFVGGQVSHTSGATVQTPVATIGVRGGNITAVHDHNRTTVMVHNGAATVSNAFGSKIVRSGYQVDVDAGSAPGDPHPIDMNFLRAATRRLASQGRQTGGANIPPTDPLASRNQIGVTRRSVDTPNFDLPAAGDDIARGFTAGRNHPYP